MSDFVGYEVVVDGASVARFLWKKNARDYVTRNQLAKAKVRRLSVPGDVRTDLREAHLIGSPYSPHDHAQQDYGHAFWGPSYDDYSEQGRP